MSLLLSHGSHIVFKEVGELQLQMAENVLPIYITDVSTQIILFCKFIRKIYSNSYFQGRQRSRKIAALVWK